jgi:leucine carboxyl methyltransferase
MEGARRISRIFVSVGPISVPEFSVGMAYDSPSWREGHESSGRGVAGRARTGAVLRSFRSVFEDVADTALWVAAYRARESSRQDALFRDPWAARLAGERGQQLAREVDGSASFEWSIIVRTCVLDDQLREAIAAGADTVVTLARTSRRCPTRRQRWNGCRAGVAKRVERWRDSGLTPWSACADLAGVRNELRA